MKNKIMKKIILLLILTFMGLGTVFGQGVRMGVNAGFPVGDVNHLTTFQLGADLAYLYPASDLFSVGGLVGYSRYFYDDDVLPLWEDDSVDDLSFLAIAATARFGSDLLFIGGDLGYAIGINDGNDSRFFYRPKVGYGVGPLIIIISFLGITGDGGDVSSVNFGVEFGF